MLYWSAGCARRLRMLDHHRTFLRSNNQEILVWMHPLPRAFVETTGSIVRTAGRAGLLRMHSVGRLGFATARHWCSIAFGASAAGGTLRCAIRRTKESGWWS